MLNFKNTTDLVVFFYTMPLIGILRVAKNREITWTDQVTNLINVTDES